MMWTPVSWLKVFKDLIFRFMPYVLLSTRQFPPAALKSFKLSVIANSPASSVKFKLSLWEYLKRYNLRILFYQFQSQSLKRRLSYGHWWIQPLFSKDHEQLIIFISDLCGFVKNKSLWQDKCSSVKVTPKSSGATSPKTEKINLKLNFSSEVKKLRSDNLYVQ